MIAYFRVEIIDGNPDYCNFIEHFVQLNVVLIRVKRSEIPSNVSCMSPSLLGGYICRNPQAGRRTMCFLSPTS